MLGDGLRRPVPDRSCEYETKLKETREALSPAAWTKPFTWVGSRCLPANLPGFYSPLSMGQRKVYESNGKMVDVIKLSNTEMNMVLDRFPNKLPHTG